MAHAGGEMGAAQDSGSPTCHAEVDRLADAPGVEAQLCASELAAHIAPVRKLERVPALFLKDPDALHSALSLLDAPSLARLSLVNRTWHAVATDERLWEQLVRSSDRLCAQWTPSAVQLLGGWRALYSNRARGQHLQGQLFPEKGPVTFADIWLTTQEILWEVRQARSGGRGERRKRREERGETRSEERGERAGWPGETGG